MGSALLLRSYSGLTKQSERHSCEPSSVSLRWTAGSGAHLRCSAGRTRGLRAHESCYKERAKKILRRTTAPSPGSCFKVRPSGTVLLQPGTSVAQTLNRLQLRSASSPQPGPRAESGTTRGSASLSQVRHCVNWPHHCLCQPRHCSCLLSSAAGHQELSTRYGWNRTV